MHSTLAFLAAIGQIATAFEAPAVVEPRGPPPDNTKPLATVTALENGHLPTCFTGHPTHPCPTYKAKRDPEQAWDDLARKLPVKPISMTASQGAHHLPTEAPAIALRDAPLRVSDGDYIPDENEWAIPQNFTFTDTISNRTNASSTSDSITTSTSRHADLRAAITQKANAMIDSITRDMLSAPASPTETEHPSALPTVMAQEHEKANSSSSAHMTGTIGTLLSQAMFPGKMRPATTTSSSASEVTPVLEPISMSQKPNTTAPEGTVQAFVHPINTESPAAAEPTTSSSVTSSSATAAAAPSSPDAAQHEAKPTDVPTGDWDEKKFDKELDEQLAAFDEEPSSFEKRTPRNLRGASRENSREWDEKKFDKELKDYLDAVPPQESSTAAKVEAEPATFATSTRPTTTSATVVSSSSTSSEWPRKITTTGPQAVHWQHTSTSSASATTTAASRNGRRFIS